MLKRILDQARQDLLKEERRRLGDLRVLLVRLGAPEESQKALAHAIAQLDELFLLVVVGEFNSGKSSLINAILGERVVEEGVTPTTSRVGVLMYGPEVDRSASGRGFEAITAPVEILREMHVVDTPGTNAIVREHEALTREFVPRADLVLFVTSADRPFTESERVFLEAIRAWGKKVVVALNKIDILESPGDVDKIVEFVKGNVLALLGFRPAVFPVSARQALRAKTAGDPDWYASSGFEALEQFLTRTLHENVRVRLKLLSPLGVANRVAGDAQKAVAARRALLREDEALLQEIEGQLARQRSELARDLRPRLAEMEKPLLDFAERGRLFIDEALRFGRAPALLRRDGIEAAFTREVATDLFPAIEKRLETVVAGLATTEARPWTALFSRLEQRQDVHAGRLGPVPAGAFMFDRGRLLKELKRDAQRLLEGDEHRGAGRRVAQWAWLGALGTVLFLGAAAVLGLAAVFAPTNAARVMALGAAAILTGIGVAWLGSRRSRAQGELASRVSELRQKLGAGLAATLDKESEQGRQRAQVAIEPYLFFVRSESELLVGQHHELAAQGEGLRALETRIESLR